MMLSTYKCIGKTIKQGRDKLGIENIRWGWEKLLLKVRLEKAMAPHSSTLAWKIPWTEEPVHGVARSQTRLSDFTLTFHFHALEEEMATHSSVLAWRIPWTEETGGLQSMGSHRVGHDWSDLAAAAATRWGYQGRSPRRGSLSWDLRQSIPNGKNSKYVLVIYWCIKKQSMSENINLLLSLIVLWIDWAQLGSCCLRLLVWLMSENGWHWSHLKAWLCWTSKTASLPSLVPWKVRLEGSIQLGQETIHSAGTGD